MSRTFTFVILIFATACEQGFSIDGNVTFAGDRPPAGTVMVTLDLHDAPVDSWTPIGVERGANLAANADDSYDLAPFGRASEAIYVAAFVDLDGDGVLGTGELYGESAESPIVNLGYGAITADIVIDSVAP